MSFCVSKSYPWFLGSLALSDYDHQSTIGNVVIKLTKTYLPQIRKTKKLYFLINDF